jgi:hypothetical protein
LEGAFMPQISIDQSYLLRMLARAALAPIVAQQKLLPSVLDDLTDRAMRSGAFSLGDATSELIGDAELFLQRLEESNSAPHLFHREKAAEGADRVSKLSPLQRLQMANAALASGGGK